MSCSVCSKQPARRCTGCFTVFYCSVECQQSHWQIHKKACRLSRKEKDLSTSSSSQTSEDTKISIPDKTQEKDDKEPKITKEPIHIVNVVDSDYKMFMKACTRHKQYPKRYKLPVTTSKTGEVCTVELREDGKLYERETGYLIQNLKDISHIKPEKISFVSAFYRLVEQLGKCAMYEGKCVWNIQPKSITPNPFFREGESGIVIVQYCPLTSNLAFGVTWDDPDYGRRPEIISWTKSIIHGVTPDDKTKILASETST
jgi:hypothetical protein